LHWLPVFLLFGSCFLLMSRLSLSHPYKTYCRKKGILFVAIDHKRPLSDQGPFDIVLHKLTGKGWQQLLEEYREAHPEVTVLDPPGAIAHLLDRQSMLQEVSELDLTDRYVVFCR